jgi:hypothetical protein
MSNVIHVQNPRALLVPDVAALIKRAVLSVDVVAPGGPDSIAKDFYDHTVNSDMFLFLGMEDGACRALVTGYFPASYLFPYPMITLIYNEGSKVLLRELVKKTVDHITAHGYSKTWALNGSGRSDEVWMRGLVPSYATGEKVASVLELAIK